MKNIDVPIKIFKSGFVANVKCRNGLGYCIINEVLLSLTISVP